MLYEPHQKLLSIEVVYATQCTLVTRLVLPNSMSTNISSLPLLRSSKSEVLGQTLNLLGPWILNFGIRTSDYELRIAVQPDILKFKVCCQNTKLQLCDF